MQEMYEIMWHVGLTNTRYGSAPADSSCGGLKRSVICQETSIKQRNSQDPCRVCRDPTLLLL